jgi:hypothetical protein
MTDNLRLVPYTPAYAGRWNALVRASKNGTFLFDRQFMDYHADRFTDASLIALDGPGDDNIIALLPANLSRERDGLWLVSHGGLSYGGWVTDARMTTPVMLRLFDLLRAWAQSRGVVNIRYKAAPRMYHRLPSDEDLYALFVHGAVLARVDVGSVIDLRRSLAWSKGKKQSVAKALKSGVRVRKASEFGPFVTLLTEALARHDARPVHTAAELELLAARFPNNIALYQAHLPAADGEDLLAAALVFDCGQTVHTQYMASSARGRELGALDAIIHHLQTDVYATREALSFGISTESDGRILNRGLVGQKEMFGGRAVVHMFYDLPVAPATA